MTQRTRSLSEDRRVHARCQGAELVRYERAGKWWLEQASGNRYPVSVADAAAMARSWRHKLGGEVFHGIPGGGAFDRMVETRDVE